MNDNDLSDEAAGYSDWYNHTLRVLNEIKEERSRQVQKEDWSLDHDDGHEEGQLASAAGCYCHESARQSFLECQGIKTGLHGQPLNGWPWTRELWRPGKPRRMLVKAAALIVAEIERLDRRAKR